MPDPVGVVRSPLSMPEVLEVAREICDRAGRGRSTHAQLHHDVETAAFVAINSPKFRALIERYLNP